MKRIFLLILIILNLFYLKSKIFSDEIFPKKNYAVIKDSFSPRDEGTRNKNQLISYIEDFSQFYNFNFKKTKIFNDKDIATNSYNAEIFIKGSSKEKEQLIIICPLNTLIINREDYDNSITIEIILDLALFCKNIQFKKDVIFLFSGANEQEKPEYNGINFFLEKEQNFNNTIITIIDIISNNKPIRFSGSYKKRPIPSILLDKFLKNKNNKTGIYFKQNEIYQARFYFEQKESYLSFFLKENISAVSFSNRENTKANLFIHDEDYKNNLTSFFQEWLLSLDDVIFPMDEDYHYLYLDFFKLRLIIPESVQVILFSIIMLLFIIIRLFFPKLQKTHIKLFIKVSPYFLVILTIYIFSSFITALFFYIFKTLFNINNVYIYTSLFYYISIFFVPLIVIFIFLNIYKILAFPLHSRLYIFGAVIFSGINLLFALIDISVIYIYLWVMITLTLSELFENNIRLNLLFYLLSFLVPLIIFINLMFPGNIELLQNVNPARLNFFFSIFSFPFILSLLKYYIGNRRKINLFVKYYVYALSIILIILVSVISIFISSHVLRKDTNVIQANLISIPYSGRNFIELKSNNEIGEIIIRTKDQENNYIIKLNSKYLETEFIEKPYSITTEMMSDNILNFKLRLTSKFLIEYLNLYLIAPSDKYPVDSNLIFQPVNSTKLNYDKKSQVVYKFLIERNIDRFFNFNISLLNGYYELYAEIEYPFIESINADFEKYDAIIVKRSIFHEKFLIDS